MLDWFADNLALIMFVSMFFFIFVGYPVAFIMGGLALAFALFGCLVLALPYCALVAFDSLDFVAASYSLGERSDSTVGLTHRWIIKSVYAAGLWLVVLGILSVLARVIVFLFGNKPESEVNLQIGHVETEV